MARAGLVAVLVSLAALTGPLSAGAWASEEANIQASCEGIVSSRVASGERSYLAHLTKSTTAPTLGFNSPGAYTSYIADFHGAEIGRECS